MRIRWAALAAVLLVTATAEAQFRSRPGDEPRIAESLIAPAAGGLFGWFDPSRFHMRHSIGFSYYSMSGGAMSLGTYTNSMTYQFADNLIAGADLSLTTMPTSSFKAFGGQDLSGISLSRAHLLYRPWENMSIQIQYRSGPTLSSPWYRPWYSGEDF